MYVYESPSTVGPVTWTTLGQPPSPSPAFSDAERQSVQNLLDQEVHNENALTDTVFFQRHPSQRGSKIGKGETALTAEWLAIRDHLVRPMLATVPLNIPSRVCCIFAPETPLGSNIVDAASLGAHKQANETIGIIYTGRAGFIDLAHLRDQCDLTEFIWTRLQGAGGAPTTIPTIQGEATITHSVPRDRWLAVAQAISFDDSLGHEIMTYDLANPGGHNSAFSPEDLCSNFIGTVVARLAIGEGGPFSTKVDAKLAGVLRALKAQTPAETRKAFDRVNGKWMDFAGPMSVLQFDYIKRRNFSRRPFKAGHPSDAATPSWVLASFGDAETFYTYTHTLVKTIPKTSFATEIGHIRADAATRYGPDFDKP